MTTKKQPAKGKGLDAPSASAFTWTELNAKLLETEDEALLSEWLQDAKCDRRMNRIRRIHSRLNAVRRARELRELEAA